MQFSQNKYKKKHREKKKKKATNSFLWVALLTSKKLPKETILI